MNEIYFPEIIGNCELTHRLSKDVAENHLAHAYIIEGQRGSGRHTIVKNIAAAIECRRRAFADTPSLLGEEVRKFPCGKCPSCQKILGEKSPDIKTYGPEEDKVTIGVDTVRFMKNDMYIAPNDLSVKVFIIENAELMTEPAQNAFLLSLEEPPEYILFFLICENASRLLETIRSRAPTLRTERIPSPEIEKYLLSHSPHAEDLRAASPEDWNTLLFVASGSIGYALDLIEDKKRKEVFEARRAAKKLISILSKKSKRDTVEAIRALGLKRIEVISRISLLQHVLRDLILLKKSENAPLCFYEDREEALTISDSFTAKTLFAIFDATEEALKDLERNSNVYLTLMNMMVKAGLL